MSQRTSSEGMSGDPSHPTAIAIRRAAAELFTQRSLASVSLRQIAERAGVNYGLIHHYFRTKEALLGEVFADFSAQGAKLIREAPDVREAMTTLLPPDSTSLYPHMLAWTVLDGSASKEFHASPAFQRIRALIERERSNAGHAGTSSEIDPRVLTATVMATILGWQFFKPFVWAAGELGELDEAETSAAVIDLLTAMIRATAASPRDQPDS